jgi:hypothetical protein
MDSPLGSLPFNAASTISGASVAKPKMRLM